MVVIDFRDMRHSGGCGESERRLGSFRAGSVPAKNAGAPCPSQHRLLIIEIPPNLPLKKGGDKERIILAGCVERKKERILKIKYYIRKKVRSCCWREQL
jgi:hypothetical protein